VPRQPVALLGLLLVAALTGPAATAAPADPVAQRVERALAAHPVIDGHNDLPWEIRDKYGSWTKPLDLDADTSKLAAPLQTDIPRLRRGHVGGQFWSVWISATVTGPAAIQMTIEQIDLVHRMAARYPAAFELASSAADIRRIEKSGRVASLIGVEGGHQIGNSLAALRSFYALGARYMTLTHSSNNDWADSATDDPVHHGLTPFGLAVIHEMNRLGMMVDISHVSPDVMRQAIAQSHAPVIFSHSSARAVMDHPRNVPDDVLRLVRAKGGIVMVNFFPGFVSAHYRGWAAEKDAEDARLKNLYPGQPERAKAALAAWDQAHPAPVVTIGEVADHIEHIRDVAGIEHVGIGSDFDGIEGTHPEGLEGVDRYPALFEELARRGWSDVDLARLSGENLLAVMEQVEQVAAAMRNEPPSLATIESLDAPTR
jgi:membrane dipeptidase